MEDCKMLKGDLGIKIYRRGVKLCLKKHPDLFYRFLREGMGPKKYGPPCKDCREQARRETKREVGKKRQPWLRKPRPLLDNI